MTLKIDARILPRSSTLCLLDEEAKLEEVLAEVSSSQVRQI